MGHDGSDAVLHRVHHPCRWLLDAEAGAGTDWEQRAGQAADPFGACKRFRTLKSAAMAEINRCD